MLRHLDQANRDANRLSGLCVAYCLEREVSTMSKHRTLLACFGSFLLAGAVNGGHLAYAASDRPTVGVLLGATFLSGGSRFDYGVAATYPLFQPIQVGAEFVANNVSVPDGLGGTVNSSQYTITGNALYSFTSMGLEGLAAGVQAGVGILTSGLPSGGSTGFIIGPSAQYNLRFADPISAGLEGTLFYNSAANTAIFVQALFAIRYHF
jgi:hypothetical protein